jgi:CcmD family protein
MNARDEGGARPPGAAPAGVADDKGAGDVKRALCAVALVALVACGSAGAAWAGQPPGAAAQDEFVPVGELPEAEQLPAAPLVIGAYAFIWVAVVGYVWFTWRRLGAVERELAQLRREIGAPPATEH